MYNLQLSLTAKFLPVLCVRTAGQKPISDAKTGWAMPAGKDGCWEQPNQHIWCLIVDTCLAMCILQLSLIAKFLPMPCVPAAGQKPFPDVKKVWQSLSARMGCCKQSEQDSQRVMAHICHGYVRASAILICQSCALCRVYRQPSRSHFQVSR